MTVDRQHWLPSTSIKIHSPIRAISVTFNLMAEQMSFPPGEIINLKGNSSSNEGSMGSDVEKVVQWDQELCWTKTFLTAVLILLGHLYESPKLNAQIKILFRFIDLPAEEYFRRRSKDVKAFEKVFVDCKAGWKTEPAQNRKWNVHFIAEQLALLLALRWQVKKVKVVERDVEQQRTLRSESALGEVSTRTIPSNAHSSSCGTPTKSPSDTTLRQRRRRRTPSIVLLLSCLR
jgi:hypothetical protein